MEISPGLSATFMISEATDEARIEDQIRDQFYKKNNIFSLVQRFRFVDLISMEP